MKKTWYVVNNKAKYNLQPPPKYKSISQMWAYETHGCRFSELNLSKGKAIITHQNDSAYFFHTRKHYEDEYIVKQILNTTTGEFYLRFWNVKTINHTWLYDVRACCSVP